MVPTYIHVTLRRPRGRIARNPLISKISTFFFFFSITYIVFFFGLTLMRRAACGRLLGGISYTHISTSLTR